MQKESIEDIQYLNTLLKDLNIELEDVENMVLKNWKEHSIQNYIYEAMHFSYNRFKNEVLNYVKNNQIDCQEENLGFDSLTNRSDINLNDLNEENIQDYIVKTTGKDKSEVINIFKKIDNIELNIDFIEKNNLFIDKPEVLIDLKHDLSSYFHSDNYEVSKYSLSKLPIELLNVIALSDNELSEIALDILNNSNKNQKDIMEVSSELDFLVDKEFKISNSYKSNNLKYR